MSSGGNWRPISNSDALGAVDAIIDQVAVRLQDPREVEMLAKQAQRQYHPSPGDGWSPCSLAVGPPGLALFYGWLERCFPHHGWGRVAHEYLAESIRKIEESPGLTYPVGMFDGWAGLCFITFLLSLGGRRYTNLLVRLETLLQDSVSHKLSVFSTSSANGVAFADYDVVSGMSGIGAYLLLRRNIPPLRTLLETLLDQLITLATDHDNLHGYFIQPTRQATYEHRQLYPAGCVDCGLAHGVPGPLALLSLAILHEVNRPKLFEAVDVLSTWLVTHHVLDPWGINWPHAVRPDQAIEEQTPGRAAWCYGGPGVASALWLAGCALGTDSLKTIAVDTLSTIMRRPSADRRIPSPILCHGGAGLLQVIIRFANRTHDAGLWAFADELLETLITMYHPDTPLGFQDFEPPGKLIDNPGFLNGVAGIALTLLAVSSTIEPEWDRILLLA